MSNTNTRSSPNAPDPDLGVASDSNDGYTNADAIYAVLTAVPAGRVVTYGQVATMAGLPGAARLVGHILRRLPEHTQLPWHRVINAQGRIALPTGSVEYMEQVKRLMAEDIAVSNGKIRLQRYQWRPEDSSNHSAAAGKPMR